MRWESSSSPENREAQSGSFHVIANFLALVFQNLLLEIDSHDGRVKSLLEEASKLSEKAETTPEQKEGLIFVIAL